MFMKFNMIYTYLYYLGLTHDMITQLYRLLMIIDIC